MPLLPTKLEVSTVDFGIMFFSSTAQRAGANVLTHLIGQDLETLAHKIRHYREARSKHGFDPDAGKVSLMLHHLSWHGHRNGKS